MNKSIPAFCVLCAISSHSSSQSLVTMIAGDFHFSEYSQGSVAEGAHKISMRGGEVWVEGISSRFQVDSSLTNNDGSTDQNGLLFGRQTQMGLTGNWGTFAMGRESNPFYYDSYSQVTITPAATRKTADALVGLSIPAVRQSLFASYVDQSEQADTVSNATAKQFSLSYTYPLSRMTNLFVARTRTDNISQIPLTPGAGMGMKAVQFGLRHVF